MPSSSSPSSLILRRRPAVARTLSPTSPSPATTQLQKPITPDPIPGEARQHGDDDEVAIVTFRPRRRPRPTFATLPSEIHLLIAHHLIYPDALSLKHTSRHFYLLVDTGVRLKVEWLMERRLLHLECPSDQRCDLGSDLRFCRGSVKCVYFLFFECPFLFPCLPLRHLADHISLQTPHAAQEGAH